MELDIIKHDTVQPPSASGGGDNAYYLRGCDVVGRSPSYASCLFKIEERLAGREHALHADCQGAIGSGTCQALGMQQQEQLQGIALYYFPRQNLKTSTVTNMSPPTMRVQPGTMRVRPDPVVSKKPKSIIDSIDTGSYASVIKTPEPAPVAPQAKVTVPITKEALARLALPGESMIDTAKRLLQAKNNV